MSMSFVRLPVFLAAAMFAAPIAAQPMVVLPPRDLELRLTPVIRRKRSLTPDSLAPRYRRGKRAQAKPRRRPNRMHISKRVRRKHRRAA